MRLQVFQRNKGVQGCTRVCKGGQGCKRVYKVINGRTMDTFVTFQKQIRIISDISKHILTLNCFKPILKTNGIFKYICKEVIFVFLTEPSMIMFHN